MFQCSVENLRAPEKIVPTDFLLKILAFFTQTQKMDFLKPAKILPHWREASALTIELKISIFSVFNFKSGKFNVEETFVLHTYKNVLLLSATWGETPKLPSGCIAWGWGGGRPPRGVWGSPQVSLVITNQDGGSPISTKGTVNKSIRTTPQLCENLVPIGLRSKFANASFCDSDQ